MVRKARKKELLKKATQVRQGLGTRPPKEWWTGMRKLIKKGYPGRSEQSVSRITAGVWHKMRPESKIGIIRRIAGGKGGVPRNEMNPLTPEETKLVKEMEMGMYGIQHRLSARTHDHHYYRGKGHGFRDVGERFGTPEMREHWPTEQNPVMMVENNPSQLAPLMKSTKPGDILSIWFQGYGGPFWTGDWIRGKNTVYVLTGNHEVGVPYSQVEVYGEGKLAKRYLVKWKVDKHFSDLQDWEKKSIIESASKRNVNLGLLSEPNPYMVTNPKSYEDIIQQIKYYVDQALGNYYEGNREKALDFITLAQGGFFTALTLMEQYRNDELQVAIQKLEMDILRNRPPPKAEQNPYMLMIEHNPTRCDILVYEVLGLFGESIEKIEVSFAKSGWTLEEYGYDAPSRVFKKISEFYAYLSKKNRNIPIWTDNVSIQVINQIKKIGFKVDPMDESKTEQNPKPKRRTLEQTELIGLLDEIAQNYYSMPYNELDRYQKEIVDEAVVDTWKGRHRTEQNPRPLDEIVYDIKDHLEWARRSLVEGGTIKAAWHHWSRAHTLVREALTPEEARKTHMEQALMKMHAKIKSQDPEFSKIEQNPHYPVSTGLGVFDSAHVIKYDADQRAEELKAEGYEVYITESRYGEYLVYKNRVVQRKPLAHPTIEAALATRRQLEAEPTFGTIRTEKPVYWIPGPDIPSKKPGESPTEIEIRIDVLKKELEKKYGVPIRAIRAPPSGRRPRGWEFMAVYGR